MCLLGGVHKLILTSIQQEFIDFECFVNRLPYLSKAPLGIHGKNEVFHQNYKKNMSDERALQNENRHLVTELDEGKFVA